VGAQTKDLGLANGFTAGRASLRDLPEEAPKNQPQIPAAVAGVIALGLLVQGGVWDPGRKETLELVQGGSGRRAQTLELGGEGRGPSGKEWSIHTGTAYILSH
jgi:hypothetical protein